MSSFITPGHDAALPTPGCSTQPATSVPNVPQKAGEQTAYYTGAPGTVRRYSLIVFGWCNLALSGLGLLLPLMPSTVFLLIALWAFSKSSPKFYHWLFTHPVLGRTLRAWRTNRVIPRQAKVLAVCTMGGSVLYVTLCVATSWTLPILLTSLLAGISTYILTRPSDVTRKNR